MRVPITDDGYCLGLISDSPDKKPPVAEGKANHLCKYRFLKNCQNANRCPQLAGVNSYDVVANQR